MGHVARYERSDASSGVFGHPDYRVWSVRREPLRDPDGSFVCGGSINRVWPVPSHLSWHFDILDILVSLSKHLSLIFILDSSSK
jgi:hypothetical protein